ncbi:hypothetical protein KWH19_04730 [Xanthomonas campestris pv. pennamericanum]|uniref:hypothetical protein n=1 Tax=Xanthomonas euvesicatoria TaxID=456327 RepID=UPI001C46E815|nr:hypothetical protein [Xanthomonas euvesicatoria]MBV6809139.1 hypothetical protein [Xanthomonas campestris pv. pennamericanum]
MTAITAIVANQITRRHSHRATSWLQPLADANLGDFVFFKLINDYFSNEIQAFGLELMTPGRSVQGSAPPRSAQ